MKPYIIIQGSSKDTDLFESQVAEALEQGYELSSDLITQVVQKNDQHEIIFLQSLVFEDTLEFEDFDEEAEKQFA